MDYVQFCVLFKYKLATMAQQFWMILNMLIALYMANISQSIKKMVIDLYNKN